MVELRLGLRKTETRVSDIDMNKDVVIQAVKQVSAKFQWVKDRRIYIGDTWSVLDTSHNRIFGDCDNFTLTCLWLICKQSIWLFIWNVLVLHKYRIYYCRTSIGEPHVVGYAEGLWFDNFSKEALPEHEFFNETKHKKYFFYPSVLTAWYMLLGKIFD